MIPPCECEREALPTDEKQFRRSLQQHNQDRQEKTLRASSIESPRYPQSGVNKLFITAVKLLFCLASRALAQIAQRMGEEKKFRRGFMFFSSVSFSRLCLVK